MGTEKTFWDARWLVIDTETTGPDPNTALVVELGFVPFQNGEPGPRYGRLLNPGVPIPADSSEVHGIYDDDVRGCPHLDDVAESFLAHVRKADVIVGYNILGFDAPLLEARLGNAWRAAVGDRPLVDPLVLVRMEGVGRFWAGAGRHRLTSVAQRFGIVAEGRAHRATTDCVLAGRVLWHLKQFSAVLALPAELAAFAAALGPLKATQDADFQAWLSRQKPSEP